MGTRTGLDEQSEFDNPALVELWRTAPYLYNDELLLDLFFDHNRDDQHGKTSHLDSSEKAWLIEFLLSI